MPHGEKNPAAPFSDLAQAACNELPGLRRYARALIGNQPDGDGWVAAALERLLAEPAALRGAPSAKLRLFGLFHLVWMGAGAPLAEPEAGLAGRVQALMAGLTPIARAALLLRAIAEFSVEESATILQVAPAQVAALHASAEQEIARLVSGRVLVVESEAITAMDIAEIVCALGHAVTGVARTRAGALALAERDPPDLILTAIQLADQSSGIEAVKDIFARIGVRPVIFVTAFPERLLGGAGPKPAFFIPKPFSEAQLRAAVAQAMFFASTETLAG